VSLYSLGMCCHADAGQHPLVHCHGDAETSSAWQSHRSCVKRV